MHRTRTYRRAVWIYRLQAMGVRVRMLGVFPTHNLSHV